MRQHVLGCVHRHVHTPATASFHLSAAGVVSNEHAYGHVHRHACRHVCSVGMCVDTGFRVARFIYHRHVCGHVCGHVYAHVHRLVCRHGVDMV